MGNSKQKDDRQSFASRTREAAQGTAFERQMEAGRKAVEDFRKVLPPSTPSVDSSVSRTDLPLTESPHKYGRFDDIRDEDRHDIELIVRSAEAASRYAEAIGSASASVDNLWRDFQNRFMELAREEQGRAQVITNKTVQYLKQVLRASCNYEGGKPEQGEICLLDRPPHGVWKYGDGINANFLERVRLCVAEAGRALPDFPRGADPEDCWLHRLFLDMGQSNSELLWCTSEQVGMIFSVCVASATFCARLERNGTNQLSEPASASPTIPSKPVHDSMMPRKTKSKTKSKSHVCAETVAKICSELYTLLPSIEAGQEDYQRLRKANPRFLTFKAIQSSPQLQDKILMLPFRQRRLIGLAQELAGMPNWPLLPVNARERTNTMRNRKQKGTIIRIGDRWYVRYWERRNTGAQVESKRVTHSLGPVTTRGKHPPADIKNDAERHMATINSGAIPAERVVTVGDFVERVYLRWIGEHKRPSTAKGYPDIWEDHLKPLCERVCLKDTRTYHVQGWLNQIGTGKLSRNTLKHIKSVISGIFTLAKQQDYFQGENPARDAAVNPKAPEPQETYAYSLEEIQTIFGLLPEPAATAFAVAAFMGLRHGEIQGLLWENYRDGELFFSRSIWNGRITDPKTRKGRAPVPLAERLEMHRLRSGNPETGPAKTGPIFANTSGNPLALTSVVNRVILPALNRCEVCRASETDHKPKDGHSYKRDAAIPEWQGWHAARRGLGSNLYRLGVPDMVIQRILRHANVSTTATYYIKTAADDVKSAMAKLESSIPAAPQPATALTDTYRTLKENPPTVSTAVN